MAVFGIRDVREQVKFLVTLERNLVFAREIHIKTLQLVDLVGLGLPEGESRFLNCNLLLALLNLFLNLPSEFKRVRYRAERFWCPASSTNNN